MSRSQKELYITEKRLSRQKYEHEKSLTDLFQQNQWTLGEISEEEEDADLLELLEIRFNELVCLAILK